MSCSTWFVKAISFQDPEYWKGEVLVLALLNGFSVAFPLQGISVRIDSLHEVCVRNSKSDKPKSPIALIDFATVQLYNLHPVTHPSPQILIMYA